MVVKVVVLVAMVVMEASAARVVMAVAAARVVAAHHTV
jgi:hypothetical protein